MTFKYLLMIGLMAVLQSWHSPMTENQFFTSEKWLEASREAKRSNKPMFIYFTTERCNVCRKMEKVTLTDSTFKAFYNENFITLKVNVDQFSGYMRSGKWNIQAVPSIVYLNQKNEVIEKSEGFKSSEQLIEKGMGIISQSLVKN